MSEAWEDGLLEMDSKLNNFSNQKQVQLCSFFMQCHVRKLLSLYSFLFMRRQPLPTELKNTLYSNSVPLPVLSKLVKVTDATD